MVSKLRFNYIHLTKSIQRLLFKYELELVKIRTTIKFKVVTVTEPEVPEVPEIPIKPDIPIVIPDPEPELMDPNVDI